MDADDLSPSRLDARLRTRWLGRAYEWHEACASTNDLAAARARGGAPEGALVATDRQSAGRGRLGRAWHSPAGENLYVSILLRPTRPAPASSVSGGISGAGRVGRRRIDT